MDPESRLWHWTIAIWILFKIPWIIAVSDSCHLVALEFHLSEKTSIPFLQSGGERNKEISWSGEHRKSSHSCGNWSVYSRNQQGLESGQVQQGLQSKSGMKIKYKSVPAALADESGHENPPSLFLIWYLRVLLSSWHCNSALKGSHPCFTPGCCKGDTFPTCSFKSWICSCFSDLCRHTQEFYKSEEKAFPFLVLWHYREGVDPLVQCSSCAKALTMMDMD